MQLGTEWILMADYVMAVSCHAGLVDELLHSNYHDHWAWVGFGKLPPNGSFLDPTT